jgi:CoA:oxalate CoA-transferase
MILDGLKVLDLTRVVAGPACTRTLADYGAEVWKIEPPDGDLMRRGVPKANGVAIGFAQQNVGKAHMCVDLSQDRGQALVGKLADQADVVVENYRPGVAKRLGLGYEQIKATNPHIVYCSITGYGQSGSAANRRAYAPVIHAELGLLHLNARERGTEPMPESVSHADFAVGAQAAGAILAALYHRERSGRGQYIDVSMAETMLAVNEFTGIEINGGIGDEISPFRPGRAALLQLGDDTFVQVPGNPTTWIFGVAKALGKDDEMQQRGWLTPADTQGQEENIRTLMQAWASEYTDVASFEAALDSARIPLGVVKALADIPDEPWTLDGGVFVDVDVNGATRRVPRSPTRFSEGPTGPRSGSYLRGADNWRICREVLGLDDQEIINLTKAGILQEQNL